MYVKEEIVSGKYKIFRPPHWKPLIYFLPTALPVLGISYKRAHLLWPFMSASLPQPSRFIYVVACVSASFLLEKPILACSVMGRIK